MKKVYISPEVQEVVFETQGVIATSMSVGVSETSVDASEAYSNKSGWSSEEWQ